MSSESDTNEMFVVSFYYFCFALQTSSNVQLEVISGFIYSPDQSVKLLLL